MIKFLPRNIVAVALLTGAIVGVPILSGCGGGSSISGGGSTGRKVGSMSFRVKWPAQSRLIPIASNAIRIVVSRDGAQVTSKTVLKPTDFTDATPPSLVTFENLEVGDSSSAVVADQEFEYTVTATAYPSDPATDASLVAQATGSEAVALSTDHPAKQITITMGSTIKSVKISSPTLGTNLGDGRSMTLTATAFNGPDGTGDMVLTKPETWTWTTDSSAGGTLDQTSGNPVVFTGSSVTNPVVTLVGVTETESGVSSNTNLTTVPVGLLQNGSPKFHSNIANSGIARAGAAVTATPAVVGGWETSAANGPIGFSSPAIGTDGTVYVGSLDGNLYAFASNGSLKWTVRTGGAIESSPTLSADGTIYIGSSDRKLYAVQDNGASARILWTNQLNGPVFGSPTIDKNGFLYFAVAEPDNQVYCVDSLNGKPRMVGGRAWSYTATGPIQAHLLMDSAETAVFVADIFGNVHKVSTETATAVWAAPYQSGSTIYSSAPALASVGGREVLLFGTIEGKFHAVDSNTGELAWVDAVDLEGQIYGTAAVSADGETVYIGTYDNISGLERSRVVALKTADGTMRWADTAAALNPGFSLGFVSSPALSSDGSMLYIGCDDGKVYGIATATGAVSWSFDSGNGNEYFESTPAVAADGTVVIGGATGRIYAIK